MTGLARQLDLAFHADELRDEKGRWTAAGLAALRSLPPAERRVYVKTGALPKRFTSGPVAEPPAARPPVPAGKTLEGMGLWLSGEGVVPDVTPAEAAAAKQVWFRDTFSYTNDYLRKGAAPSVSAEDAIREAGHGLEGPARARIRLALPAESDAGYIRSIGVMTAMMGRAPAFSRPAVMYRDVSGPGDVFGPVGSMKGRVFTDRGLVSATTDLNTAEKYGKDEQPGKIIIHVPVGGKAMRSSLAFSPDYAREKEYTFLPGSRFRVDDDKIVNGQRQTEVTMIIPPGATPGPRPAPIKPRIAVRQPWEGFSGHRYNVETGELV